MNKTITTLIFFSVATLSAELIPPARLTTWTAGVTSGVPGGIDQYRPGGVNQRTTLINVTLAPYFADNTGATDARAAIQSAINAATPGQVVYLPAGRYRCNTTLGLKSNITLRGAGMNATIIDSRDTSMGISVVDASAWNWAVPASGSTVTAGLTKNSTTVTIANTTEFIVGNIIRIYFEDENDNTAIQAGAVPVWQIQAYRNVRSQMGVLESKTATTLTFSPGLHHTVRSGLSAFVKTVPSQMSRVGIEDLTLDCTIGGAGVGIRWEQGFACWALNVKVTLVGNYGFHWYDSLFLEARRCWLDRANSEGSNHAGLKGDNVCQSLFEDNIVHKYFPLIELNFACAGNIIAYNILEDSTVFGVLGGALNTNHSPHNAFNLIEGNIVANVQCDGYFGGTSDDTLFRNWFHGQKNKDTPTGDGVGFTLALNRFTRNYNLVGNIFGKTGTLNALMSYGNPNLGNSDFTGTAQPTLGDFWVDWAAYKTWTPAGSRPQTGFQEKDLDVEASTIKKGNLLVGTGVESLGGDPLPDSLFRSSKPSYFGNLTWPPFTPTAPNESYTAIPAGYRYINGTDPPFTGGIETINVTNLNVGP